MHEEEGFLRALAANPADDATRLVYADWLEEQRGPNADVRAEFLRLTVHAAQVKVKKTAKKRLRELAGHLGADWLAVVSRLSVENCQGKRATEEARRGRRFRFDYLCERGWEDLQPTDDRTTRFCAGCQQNVHYCSTIEEARGHTRQQHCVAVELAVIRHRGDLEPPMLLMGKLRLDEEEAPDEPSADRGRLS